MTQLTPIPHTPDALVSDLRRLIADARRQAALVVNMSLTALYWQVGRRISQELLHGDRAVYGEALIEEVAERLTGNYGRGFTRKNLWRMVQFAEAFPMDEIVATLWRQLSWSHFRELLPLRQPFQREFYAEVCRVEGWSVRTLHERIESMLYERTALAKQPDKVIERELATLRSKGEVSQTLILKDPYILDFLGLEDRYLERDPEDAILRELELSLLELGAGFSFIARQKRIQLDGWTSTSTCCSITASSSVWSRSISSRAASSPSSRGRWNSISAGSLATRPKRGKARRWASSSAQTKAPSRSSCLNSMHPASMSPNI